MTLEAIEAALDSAADADEALRGVVRELASMPGVVWAGIAFTEEDELLLGPSSGQEDEAHRRLVTLSYKGQTVGELRVDGKVDQAFLEAVADRISEHALLAWDTGGEAWEP